MKIKNISTLEAAQEKYQRLARYKRVPIKLAFVKAYAWIDLIFSAAGNGWFYYWVSTLQYRGEGIIWWFLAICIIMGFGLSVSMYLEIYFDTAEKVNQEFEPVKKRFNNLLFFESNMGVLLVRAVGVIGMILFGYGKINAFNDYLSAQAESQEFQKRQYSNTESRIKKLEDDLFLWVGKKSNGTADDDLEAENQVSQINRELGELKSRYSQLSEIVQSDIQSPQIIDNTAIIRFIAKGNDYWYGLLIIIMLGLASLAIDNAAASNIKAISRHDQAEQAEKDYQLEISLSKSIDSTHQPEADSRPINRSTSTPVEGSRGDSGSGGDWDKVDFSNPKNVAILEALNEMIMAGDSAEMTQAEIATKYGVSPQRVSDVKKAAARKDLLYG